MTIVFEVGGDFTGNVQAAPSQTLNGFANESMPFICAGLKVTGTGISTATDSITHDPVVTLVTSVEGTNVVLSVLTTANPANTVPPAGIYSALTFTPYIPPAGTATIGPTFSGLFRTCGAWKNVTAKFASIKVQINLTGSANADLTVLTEDYGGSRGATGTPSSSSTRVQNLDAVYSATGTLTFLPFTGPMPDFIPPLAPGMSPPTPSSTTPDPHPPPLLNQVLGNGLQPVLARPGWDSWLPVGKFVVLKCTDCCTEGCFYFIFYRIDPASLTAMTVVGTDGPTAVQALVTPGGFTVNGLQSDTFSGITTTASYSAAVGLLPSFQYSDRANFCYQNQTTSSSGNIALGWSGQVGEPATEASTYMMSGSAYPPTSSPPSPILPNAIPGGVNLEGPGDHTPTNPSGALTESAVINSCTLPGVYECDFTQTLPVSTAFPVPSPIPPPSTTVATVDGTTTTTSKFTASDGTLTTVVTISEVAPSTGYQLFLETTTTVQHPDGSTSRDQTLTYYDGSASAVITGKQTDSSTTLTTGASTDVSTISSYDATDGNLIDTLVTTSTAKNASILNRSVILTITAAP